MNVKCISYNIHSGVGIDNKFSYLRIGEYLASSGADIVCLQEMDLRQQVVNKKEAVQGLKTDCFPYFYHAPAIKTENGDYGNAILSRYPAVFQHVESIAVSGRQARNFQHLRFSIKGIHLDIINTHFGLKSRERRIQFARLIDYINTIEQENRNKLIVTGDFNEWRPTTQSLHKMNRNLMKVKLEASFPTQFPLFKLDKFWHGKDIHRIQAKVLKNEKTKHYSDHYPVEMFFNIYDANQNSPFNNQVHRKFKA